MKKKKVIDYSKITSKQINEEILREKHKKRYANLFKSTFKCLVVVVAFCALIATLVMPVFRISGATMYPTLNEKDIVIAIKASKFKQGEIIAFYHGNKILVKRVIACAGSFVNIDKNGVVFVDNKKIEEDYVSNLSLGDGNIVYPYQVPESTLFVLGDNREFSLDSRNSEIGTVSEKDIVGKVILRVWPVSEIKILK